MTLEEEILLVETIKKIVKLQSLAEEIGWRVSIFHKGTPAPQLRDDKGNIIMAGDVQAMEEYLLTCLKLKAFL